MMTIRKIAIASITGLALLSTAAIAVAHNATTDTHKKAELNFVQTAKKITFNHSKSGHASMTLHGVASKTLWFANRPVRKAGSHNTTIYQ